MGTTSSTTLGSSPNLKNVKRRCSCDRWSSAADADSAARKVERLLSIIAENKLPPLYVWENLFDFLDFLQN